MLDTNHPDYKNYRKEFERIKENMKKDYDEVTTNQNCMDSKETSSIHQKYALQIKTLQQKYSHLFIEKS